MPNTFYILSVRSAHGGNVPTLVDWVIARCGEVSDAKREARRIAETASASEWIWPMAEAIQVLDERGVERFRCWCRVVLPARKRELKAA